MNATPRTPRALRPHIVLTGKCNAGKSTLLNALVGHDLAIVAPTAGTTTDPVVKSSELVPFGPVAFVDTAGNDDQSELAAARAVKTRRAVAEADAIVYVVHRARIDSDDLDELRRLAVGDAPLLVALTHGDLSPAAPQDAAPVAEIQQITGSAPLPTAAPTGEGVATLREALIEVLRRRKAREKSLLEDLIRPYRLIMLIVPIDLEAPAGRLIMPQVQTIREVLDADAATIVVKEREVSWVLDQLKRPPDLAITDSQVVLKAAGAVPPHIPLTTFSILFSRYKGDLARFVRNAKRIDTLNHGDRILITESCSHHTHCDDIARVKIPRWLRQYTGKELRIDVVGGRFPDNAADYNLAIHCGACMITRTQMHARMHEVSEQEVPLTNYGVAISHVHGVLDRVLEPFAGEV